MPSRKFIFIALAVLLICAGIFGFVKLKERSAKSIGSERLNKKMEEIAIRAFEIDSDNDGLKDWEEILWKTDINNSDSDNDGYSDNEEIKGGFDPLDSLSNSKTGKKGIGMEQTTFLSLSVSANLTQEIAKSMGLNIIESKEKGVQPDISDPLKFINQQNNQDLARFVAGFYIKIPENELKVSSDNSPAAIQKYNDEIHNAIPQNPYMNKAEDEIFAEAMQFKDFKVIDEYIQYYDKVIANMKNIAVPSDFLEIHKQLVANLMATQRVYKTIKEIDADPLRVIIALEQNNKIRKEVKNLLLNFLDLAQKHFQ